LALWARARGLSIDSLLAAAQKSGRFDLPGLPSAYAGIPDDFLGEWDDKKPYALTFPMRFIGPPSVAEAQEGRTNTFETYSSSLAPTTAAFLPDAFKDRIVLLGTGFHDSDKFRTPFYNSSPATVENSQAAATYGWMYGVEL